MRAIDMLVTISAVVIYANETQDCVAFAICVFTSRMCNTRTTCTDMTKVVSTDDLAFITGTKAAYIWERLNGQ